MLSALQLYYLKNGLQTNIKEKIAKYYKHVPKYLQNHTIKTDVLHPSLDQAFKIGKSFNSTTKHCLQFFKISL